MSGRDELAQRQDAPAVDRGLPALGDEKEAVSGWAEQTRRQARVLRQEHRQLREHRAGLLEQREHRLAEARDLLVDGGTGRLLNPEELAELALVIVGEPALWRPLVKHDPDERRHESLYTDEHLGIWVISWMPGHDTGFHDHECSCGGVAVAEGAIREERPIWGAEPRRIDPSAGGSFCFDATELHRMVDLNGEPAVTIHAYSPPIQRMGLYSIDDDGYVRRRSIPWDQTLDADDT